METEQEGTCMLGNALDGIHLFGCIHSIIDAKSTIEKNKRISCHVRLLFDENEEFKKSESCVLASNLFSSL